ncbi:MAG: ROK family protein [Candidatus Fermentibacteraceae bacterium]|nr:ROK family protein [Candidatus Fermentibacteraceae bacterium]MBN2608282.1 ROK family protein [Candidatus Fermentibacteraceae bacterium]
MIDRSLCGYNWGVDIGGTTIILGFLEDERFAGKAVLDTGRHRDPEEILGNITRAILNSDPDPATVGVGIAGLVIAGEGILVSSPNLPQWRNYPVRSMLSESLNCPVVVDNDSNVFAVGAVRTGQIPAEGLWLMVTLGTGIGGTIVYDGEVVYGTGFAGEFGHMTVEASGEQCPCGSRGCWERYAAAGALTRYFRHRSGLELPPREIASLASEGNPQAAGAFEEFGRWLGIGLLNLCQCFSPMGIFLAGGLMGGSRFFLSHAEREYRGRCERDWNVRVLPSSSDAGARGAAIMGRERLR